jgi:hypothetical protein
MFKATHDVTPFNGPQPKVETIFRAAARPAGPDSGTKAVMTMTDLAHSQIQRNYRAAWFRISEFGSNSLMELNSAPLHVKAFTLAGNSDEKRTGLTKLHQVPKSWQ